MLTAPVIDGDRVVLVASKAGGLQRRRRPKSRLVPQPGGPSRNRIDHRRPASAHAGLPGFGEGEGRVVARVVAAYGGYGGYQRRTERDIR
jgi:hypothetical protein